MINERNGIGRNIKRAINFVCRHAYALRHLLRKIQGFTLVVSAILSLSGCSIEISQTTASEQFKSTRVNRKDPDFITGEIVKTSAGHQMTGVFGEVLENTKSFNKQWEIEGVFYE